MDWLEALKAECKKTNQADVSTRLGVSTAQISTVLKGKYTGTTDRLEMKVRGALMGRTINCPVEEEITEDKCLHNQELPFATTHHMRVRLYKACRKCEHCLDCNIKGKINK